MGLALDRLHRPWSPVLGTPAVGVVSLALAATSGSTVALAGLCVGALAGSGPRVLLITLTDDMVEPGHQGQVLGALTFSGDVDTEAGPVVQPMWRPRTRRSSATATRTLAMMVKARA